MATSSIMSAWCRTSARVGGMWTSMRSGEVGEGVAWWDMRVRSVQSSGAVRVRPQQAFM